MNAANLLTLSRLALTAPIIVLVYAGRPWAAWAAFGLFIAAMLTDVFDGKLAKRDPNRSPDVRTRPRVSEYSNAVQTRLERFRGGA